MRKLINPNDDNTPTLPQRIYNKQSPQSHAPPGPTPTRYTEFTN